MAINSLHCAEVLLRNCSLTLTLKALRIAFRPSDRPGVLFGFVTEQTENHKNSSMVITAPQLQKLVMSLRC